MKAAIALLFVVLAFALDDIPSDITLSCAGCSDAERVEYYRNREFVEKRNLRGDKSVMYSIYTKEDRVRFNDTCMIHGLEYLHVENLNVNPELPLIINHIQKGQNEYNPDLLAAVSTSLGELPLSPDQTEYPFVVYALTDLMNLEYSMNNNDCVDCHLTWLFDPDRLLDEVQKLGRDPIDKSDVLNTIQDVGMCLIEDTSKDCKRYSFQSRRYVDAKNVAIATALTDKPLYVQVGIDSVYYQHYGRSAAHPLHACFGEPNMAGVLVGCHLVEASNSTENYWDVYFRRHGEYYNEVKMLVDLSENSKLTCGMGAVVYSINLGEPSWSMEFDVNHVWRVTLDDVAQQPLDSKEALEALVTSKLGGRARDIHVVYVNAGVFAPAWNAPAHITDYLEEVNLVYFINEPNCPNNRAGWLAEETSVHIECK